MPDFTNCTVTFTHPKEYTPEVMDDLVHLLTGQSLSDFVREVQQNKGGKYDALYEEDTP